MAGLLQNPCLHVGMFSCVYSIPWWIQTIWVNEVMRRTVIIDDVFATFVEVIFRVIVSFDSDSHMGGWNITNERHPQDFILPDYMISWMYVTLAFKPFSIFLMLWRTTRNMTEPKTLRVGMFGKMLRSVLHHTVSIAVCIIFKLTLLSASFTCCSNM